MTSHIYKPILYNNHLYGFSGFSVMKTRKQTGPSTELIDISHVPELAEVKVTGEGVTLGGTLSLSQVMIILEDLMSKQKGSFRAFPNVIFTLILKLLLGY